MTGLLTCAMGCAPKVIVQNDGATKRVIRVCPDGGPCFSDKGYDITWDKCLDFPVDYRAKQYPYEFVTTDVYQGTFHH